ncbi:hypothetical protein CC78DRAFT_584668 [Lojkania enalia]|uniref:Rhodopsin domain-containing protein n=1 Tax=Lojkania enalia TaxID=147567 RepID=A0A9P4N0J1_9PLEO|nr:hypothetical protein CC78DRAFT_584668 [Didymosphaeria enalia]
MPPSTEYRMDPPSVNAPSISFRRFEISIWVFSSIAALFVASRFIIRIYTKGQLMVNDYFLILALPALFVAAGLLQTVLHDLYDEQAAGIWMDPNESPQPKILAPRLTASMEMLWLTIYCVKFCFLAQFKFHKPPYAYISPYFTRYYWVAIGTCGAAFLFTLIQPIVLCSNAEHCRYFQSTNTGAWETTITAVDIATDLLVISIPILLIYMANFTKSYTIINATFKGLSMFAIAIAATRLALQYSTDLHRIKYISLLFWLFVEAAVALIMASISSYRTVVLDRLAEWERRREGNPSQKKTHGFWPSTRDPHPKFHLRPTDLASDDRSDCVGFTPSPSHAKWIS